ncbi:MAG TPA: DsbA family protein, partial [Nannocystaceae bacterium]|nr:DsbA family protein [Nannocystaceae bacterium]
AVRRAVKRLRLDKRRFARDVASPKTEAIIATDEQLARDFGVDGTPAFFVNGRHIAGAQPLESFQAVVLEELAKARAFAERDPGGAGTLYDRMIATFTPAPAREVVLPRLDTP